MTKQAFEMFYFSCNINLEKLQGCQNWFFLEGSRIFILISWVSYVRRLWKCEEAFFYLGFAIIRTFRELLGGLKFAFKTLWSLGLDFKTKCLSRLLVITNFQTLISVQRPKGKSKQSEIVNTPNTLTFLEIWAGNFSFRRKAFPLISFIKQFIKLHISFGKSLSLLAQNMSSAHEGRKTRKTTKDLSKTQTHPRGCSGVFFSFQIC